METIRSGTVVWLQKVLGGQWDPLDAVLHMAGR